MESRLKNLRAERGAAQVRIDALDVKHAMKKHYSRASPANIGAEGKALQPEDWPQAWDVIGAALEKVGLDLRAARAAVAEFDARIMSLEAARPTPSVASPAQDVAVDVDAAKLAKSA